MNETPLVLCKNLLKREACSFSNGKQTISVVLDKQRNGHQRTHDICITSIRGYVKFAVPLGLASGSEVERAGRDLDLGCDEVALPANALGCTGMSLA